MNDSEVNVELRADWERGNAAKELFAPSATCICRNRLRLELLAERQPSRTRAVVVNCHATARCSR